MRTAIKLGICLVQIILLIVEIKEDRTELTAPIVLLTAINLMI